MDSNMALCLQLSDDDGLLIGLRVDPETVRELFDQYCRGLIEAQLDKKQPNVPHESDIERVDQTELERRLAALPEAQTTRISVGRWRGSCPRWCGSRRLRVDRGAGWFHRRRPVCSRRDHTPPWPGKLSGYCMPFGSTRPLLGS